MHTTNDLNETQRKMSSKKLTGLSEIWQLVNGVGRIHGLWIIDNFCFHSVFYHRAQETERRNYEKEKL